MLKSEVVTIVWSSRNKNHFVSKGYNFTKVGDTFDANVNDLSSGSRKCLDIICDCCGKEFKRAYNEYVKFHDDKFGDTCCHCSKYKRKRTNVEKYGVEWYTQSNTFNQKREETMINRYSTVHALQCKEIMDKFKNTCIKNNGVEFPMLSEDVKLKRRETCIERYGDISPLNNFDVRKKIEKTCIDKYGIYTTALVSDIRAKQRESLYHNGSIMTSKPERESIKLLKDIYGDENCIEQYPTHYYNLDCLLTVNNVKIDFEYDGMWCHKEDFDERRDKYHKNHGYKILRVKGNTAIPTKEQIMESVDMLVYTDADYVEINLENHIN